MSSGMYAAPAPALRPNSQLISLIEQAAMSNKQFARAVRDTAARHGRDAKCTHTSVQRWRDGRMSRAVPPELIAETLALRLGRIVTTADIGMARPVGSTRSPWTPEFLDDPVELVAAARALWVSDLDRHSSTRYGIPAAALSGPALHWLVADTAAAPVGHGPGHDVTPVDLARFSTTFQAFDLIARRTGGIAARLPAVQFLQSSLAPLLTGRYPGTVGRSVFRSAALAHLSVGRYTHDAGLHGLARRYLLLALSMAHHGEDRVLGAHVLAALAEHAPLAGDHPGTFDLVRAALLGTAGHGRRARAALHAAEARFHAARQDAGATKVSLERSAKGLVEAGSDNDAWLDYFGAAELADTTLRCLLELGELQRARGEFEAASVTRSPDRLTDQVLALCLLATAHFRSGEISEACQAVEDALDRAQGVQSAAVNVQLAQLAHYLDEHRGTRRAASLGQRVRVSHRL
ncbi:hypothetical protein [Streptacidiphilus anmyonensis]|uniref:hypothetical protein n=1 Tax=Streptacidiphilus anmyonensis TaxID=405782 RepID=UPI00128B0C8B|nr:hypothetical protein [Streptacidiphilus anmyonensis]